MHSEAIRIGEGSRAFRHRRLPAHCVRPLRRTPELSALERRQLETGVDRPTDATVRG